MKPLLSCLWLNCQNYLVLVYWSNIRNLYDKFWDCSFLPLPIWPGGIPPLHKRTGQNSRPKFGSCKFNYTLWRPLLYERVRDKRLSEHWQEMLRSELISACLSVRKLGWEMQFHACFDSGRYPCKPYNLCLHIGWKTLFKVINIEGNIDCITLQHTSTMYLPLMANSGGFPNILLWMTPWRFYIYM